MVIAGKLDIMHVKSYDLFLDIDSKNLKFNGRVLIELESEDDVVLNSIGLDILNICTQGKSLQFEQIGEDLVIKTGMFKGVLEIDYAGLVSDRLVGIYKAPYDNTYMLTTQFEAAHARRMLPCIDHPGYKAEFKLKIKIDKELDAISNMPIESVTSEDGKKIVSFQRTPRMPTYLLYLGIGKFEEIKDKIDTIDIIVATTLGKAKKGKFAIEVAKRALQFYQNYFEIPYILPKLHLIAVPEFAAGAMENWGAVTFRETAILVDDNSGVRTRKRVTETVAHELAHMWFGDLVTMMWWDDLWLNESLATFVAFKVMDDVFPQWKVWQDFLRGETAGALVRDSLIHTHSIHVSIKSPAEIEQIFDEISYGKGGSVLRMIEAYVGAEDLRKGLSSFLKRYKLSNASGEDLWNSIEEISGKQVKRIMNEWVKKPGYPLVTVSLSKGKLTLKQERFLLSGASEKDVWPIPLTLEVNGKVKRELFDKKKMVVDIKDIKSLKLNVDQTGVYRVYYKDLYDFVWRSKLSAFDRWGILFDAVAFLIAGKMPFDEYLNLLKRYYCEREYLPALEASDQLAFLYSIIPTKVAEVSREFHKSQLKILRKRTDENSSMLRGVMAGRLAMVDEDYAKKLGGRFVDYEKVSPDMREAVAMAYARAYNNFEEIVKKYKESSSDEEKVRFLTAMMSFKKSSLIALSLGLALSGDVKRQDVISMIASASRNPDAKDTAWTWLKVNVDRLNRLYEGTGIISRIYLSIVPILGIGRIDEVRRFFEENKTPEVDKGMEAGLEILKIYDKFVKRI